VSPFVGVSLKAYLDVEASRRWLAEVAAVVDAPPVELAVFPSALLLAEAVSLLAPLRIRVGAQDVSVFGPGAHTGELPAEHLAGLGVDYAEVGHAERRGALGEGDGVVRRKLAAAARAGMAPLLCVGETRRGPAESAALEVVRQLDSALDGLPDSPLMVAYEPVWAIGARDAAPAEHVREVARAIRERVSVFTEARVIYGGSAGPGTITALADSVDGLFLGRSAHRVASLTTSVAEVVAALTERTP